MISRLQGISKVFMNEKLKHKDNCEQARKCPHEMSCSSACYYTDKYFLQSDVDEESDEEDSSDDDVDSDSPTSNNLNESTKNKCSICNFEGKNLSGLKIHMKSDHKNKCKICEFKTTTNVLMKKHMKGFNVFVN